MISLCKSLKREVVWVQLGFMLCHVLLQGCLKNPMWPVAVYFNPHWVKEKLTDELYRNLFEVSAGSTQYGWLNYQTYLCFF